MGRGRKRKRKKNPEVNNKTRLRKVHSDVSSCSTEDLIGSGVTHRITVDLEQDPALGRLYLTARAPAAWGDAAPVELGRDGQ